MALNVKNGKQEKESYLGGYQRLFTHQLPIFKLSGFGFIMGCSQLFTLYQFVI